jgi:type IV pilus assembly protein PilN
MIEVNLLPVREARRRADVRQQGLQLLLVLMLAFGAVGLVHARMQSQIERVEGRIVQMKRDIDRFKPQLDQVAAFKKKKNELEKKIDVIDGLARARSGPIRVMAELADRTPERLWITSLENKGGSLAIQGKSLDNEIVAHFLRALGESEWFEDVDLDSTKLGNEKTGLRLVQFSIRASLQKAKPAKPAAARPGRPAKPAKKG